MTTATERDSLLRLRLEKRGIEISEDDARILRRAERTLHTWAEQECGDGNDRASWAIERDEATGKPYRCVYWHMGDMRRYLIADREAGALRRVKDVCERNGLVYYHQGDPRGCALYVAKKADVAGCKLDEVYSALMTACCGG